MTSPIDAIDDPGDDVDVLDDAYEVMLLAKNGLNFQHNKKIVERAGEREYN